jgi:outer membrane protein assembly factor BamB
VDRKSGKKQWEGAIEVEKLEPVHKVNSHATSTPVADKDGVYAYFGSFGLVAYDLKGKERWRKSLPVPKTFFDQGSSTSPILAGGKLVVFVQSGSDSHLLAVDPKDGKEAWKAEMPMYNNSWSSPVSWQEGGETLVGLSCAMRFTAFNAGDGKESWTVEGLGFQVCSTPVVAGDRMILTAAGVQGEASNVTPPPSFEDFAKKYDADKDGLIAFNEIPEDYLYTDRQSLDGKGNMPLRQAFSMFGRVKKEDKINEAKWESIRKGLIDFRTGAMNRTVVMAVRTGGKGSVGDSHVVWKDARGVPEVPSPLVWKDRVYLIRSGGLLVCRALDSGKLIYEERVEAPGGYYASPVLADGRIYVASDRGTVTVIKPGDALEVVAHNELGDPIMASPALADNTLYVRSAKQLWAFRAKAK